MPAMPSKRLTIEIRGDNTGARRSLWRTLRALLRR